MISIVKSNWHWDLHFNMINWLAKDLPLVLSIFYHFIDQHLKNALLSSKDKFHNLLLIRANYLLTEKFFWYYFLFSKRSLRLACFHIFPLIIYCLIMTCQIAIIKNFCAAFFHSSFRTLIYEYCPSIYIFLRYWLFYQ